MGEISDGGVHARGLTFETAANAEVVAPANARVAYAGRFGSYDMVVILDHGGGWLSAITNLAAIDVERGETVRMGEAIGRTAAVRPRLSVELRHEGRPVPIVPLISSS
jgi:septal ring factor EnvC (AmiA/AmiB activator)